MDLGEIIKNKNNWALKKYLSGKGDGMLVGKDAAQEDFKNILYHHADRYIAQEYVAQKYIPVITDIPSTTLIFK